MTGVDAVGSFHWSWIDEHRRRRFAEIAEAHHGRLRARTISTSFGVERRAASTRLAVGRWDRRVRGRVPHRRRCRSPGGATSSPRAGPADSSCRVPSIGRRAVGTPWRRAALAEITCPRWRRAQHDGLVVHETHGAERARHHDRRRDSRSRRSSERSSTSAAVCSRRHGRSRDRQRAPARTHDARRARARCSGACRDARAEGHHDVLRGLLADRDGSTHRRRANVSDCCSRALSRARPSRAGASVRDPRRRRAASSHGCDLAYPRSQDRDRVRQLPGTRRQGGARPRQPAAERHRGVGWLTYRRDGRGRPARKAARWSPAIRRALVALRQPASTSAQLLRASDASSG